MKLHERVTGEDPDAGRWLRTAASLRVAPGSATALGRHRRGLALSRSELVANRAAADAVRRDGTAEDLLKAIAANPEDDDIRLEFARAIRPRDHEWARHQRDAPDPWQRTESFADRDPCGQDASRPPTPP